MSTILDALRKASQEKTPVRSPIEQGTLYQQAHAQPGHAPRSDGDTGQGVATAALAVGALILTAAVFVGVVIWASRTASQTPSAAVAPPRAGDAHAAATGPPPGQSSSGAAAGIPQVTPRVRTIDRLEQYRQSQLRPAAPVAVAAEADLLPDPAALDTELDWDLAFDETVIDEEEAVEEVERWRPSGFTLEGIVWDADNPMAIIDGQIAGVGDWVGEGRITSIERQSITLEVNGEQRVIRY